MTEPAPADRFLADGDARIVDCHVHVFGSSRDVAAPCHPHPEEPARFADVAQLGHRFGVRRHVLTQPSFLGFDNDVVLATVADRRDDARAVVWLPPTTDPDGLSGLRARGVAGLRFPLKYAREKPDWPAYADLFRAAAASGLHVELGSTGLELARAVELVLGFGADVVLAHLGMFEADLGPDGDPAFAVVVEAASTGRVWVKLSAPYRTTPRDADRACALLLDRLGPQRLVWGSDWPHVGPRLDRFATYADTVAWFCRRVTDATIRHRILVASPAELYGFGDAGQQFREVRQCP